MYAFHVSKPGTIIYHYMDVTTIMYFLTQVSRHRKGHVSPSTNLQVHAVSVNGPMIREITL